MWNSSPLMIAIQYDKIEIVNYLLDFDAIGFDHVNDKGVTALLLDAQVIMLKTFI